MPQVLAAGWHEMGTVFAARSVDFDACYEAAMIPSALESRLMRHSLAHTTPPGLHETPPALNPSEFANCLNARTIPPLPTIDDLQGWGVPEVIGTMLRDLVVQGEEESAVVLAFLYALSESDAGSMIWREARRPIIKAFRRRPPSQSLMKAAIPVCADWHRVSTIADCAP
jgi:hypothetical protein